MKKAGLTVIAFICILSAAAMLSFGCGKKAPAEPAMPENTATASPTITVTGTNTPTATCTITPDSGVLIEAWIMYEELPAGPTSLIVLISDSGVPMPEATVIIEGPDNTLNAAYVPYSNVFGSASRYSLTIAPVQLVKNYRYTVIINGYPYIAGGLLPSGVGVSSNGLNCYWTNPGNNIEIDVIKYPLGPGIYSTVVTDSPASFTITPDPYPTPSAGTEYYNFNVNNSNIFNGASGAFPGADPASSITLQVRKTYRITKY